MRQANAKELTAALHELRTHTLSSFQAYARANKLQIPYKPEFNPPLWELGHIAWFQEHWIARNQQRSQGVALQIAQGKNDSLLAHADQWFDSAKVQHVSRWDQALLTQDVCLAYASKLLNCCKRNPTAVLHFIFTGSPCSTKPCTLKQVPIWHRRLQYPLKRCGYT